MTCIQLLAVGESDPSLLGLLGPALEAEFCARRKILEAGFDPVPSLHPRRRQYFSIDILNRMRNVLVPDSGRILGVKLLDLYLPAADPGYSRFAGAGREKPAYSFVR